MNKIRLLMRKWAIPSWFLGTVAIMLVVMLEILTFDEGLQILLMYTLVLVSAQYVKSTEEIAKGTGEERIVSLQPIIVVERPLGVTPDKAALM